METAQDTFSSGTLISLYPGDSVDLQVDGQGTLRLECYVDSEQSPREVKFGGWPIRAFGRLVWKSVTDESGKTKILNLPFENLVWESESHQ